MRKDLPISKGGTIDFDPKMSNKMVEEREDGTDGCRQRQH